MTIQKIKVGLAKAKALILGNAKALSQTKGRIRTKAQAAAYAKLVQKQKKQQELYKKIYSKFQKLVEFINKAKAAGQWVKGKITGAAGAAARRIKGLFSRRGTRGIGDLGIAPLIAAAAVIAALLAAVGFLLSQTITQKEEIDGLNEKLDEYEKQGGAAPEEREAAPEDEAEEPPAEDEEEW